MRRIVLVAILASGLQGCAWAVQGISNLEDVNIIEPEPLGEEKTAVFETATAQSTYLRKIFLDRRGEAEDVAFGTSTSSADASLAADRYFQSGITLSNALCSEWFGRLERSNVAMAETRDTLANAGTATTTIMGATSASTEALTIVASVFGLGRQAATDLSNNYVITPDLAQVEQMMSDYRANYVNSVFTTDDRTDFQRATRALILYHSLCTGPVVKSLVNRSISEANLQPSNATKAFEDTILAAAARDISKDFDGITLTSVDLQYLYAFEFQDAVGAKPALDKIVKYLQTERLMAASNQDILVKDKTKYHDDMKQVRASAGPIIEPSVKRLVNELVPPPPPVTSKDTTDSSTSHAGGHPAADGAPAAIGNAPSASPPTGSSTSPTPSAPNQPAPGDSSKP